MTDQPEQILSMPASNQPVMVPVPPPAVTDERLQPFYKRKTFKYIIIALIAAAVAYYYFVGKPVAGAIAEQSVQVLPQQMGGEYISVPAYEHSFDVGGDYDA